MNRTTNSPIASRQYNPRLYGQLLPVVNTRTNHSNSARSRSLNTTFGGLGVAIVHSGQFRMHHLTRLPRESRLSSADLYWLFNP